MWFENGRRGLRPLWAAVCAIGLIGCASQPEEDPAAPKRGAIGKSDYPVTSGIARQTGDPYTDLGEDKGRLFDATTSFGLPSWLGGSDDDEEETAAVAPGGTGIQVNGYLWGAALDTISFMPLDTADPQGGIIKTEWYSDPDQPDQRHRVHVFIVSGQLRADGVRVSVFRQTRNDAGEWVDVEPPADTASALKDVIVRRARELGVASTG